MIMLQSFVIFVPRPVRRVDLQISKKRYNFLVSFLFLYFLFMKLSSLQKRFVIAIPLSILAGIICFAVANSSTPGIWGTALMWTIITNRIVIGMIVGLAGAYIRHPIFGFPIPSYFRGFCLGVFVSVSLAAGAMMTPETSWMIF